MVPRDIALQSAMPTVMAPRFSPLDELDLPGRRLVMAENGTWLETRREWLYSRLQVGQPCPVPLPYGQVTEALRFSFGKLPRAIIAQFIEHAREQLPNECAARVIWNSHTSQWTLKRRDDVISVSPGHVNMHLPPLGEREHLIMDLHSHGITEAFFSRTDNKDDRGEVKISGVVGNLEGGEVTTAFRLCLAGVFVSLPFNNHDHGRTPMRHNIDSRLLTQAVKVVLVGAGGTGSHVLRRLANIHLAMVELGHPAGLDVLVVDPDTVSPTNVGRQNFYPSDVGHSKAAILVHRCNMQLQTKWRSAQKKVEPGTDFGRDVHLVIGCVDNRKGRAAIVRALGAGITRPVYYLDFGNREHDGQVILGEIFPPKYKPGVRGPRLPHVGDLFPDILDESLDDKDETPSCSLTEALEKQSLFINDTMANAGMNMLWELFRYGGISHHGQFVNIKSGRTMPLPVDPEAWKRFGYTERQLKKRSKAA